MAAAIHRAHLAMSRPSSAPCSVRPSARIITTGAANLGNATPSTSSPVLEQFLSGHPDAVRRRQQAEARQASAVVDAEVASRTSWWECPTPSNLIPAISPETLQAVLGQERLVVVDYFAPWCAACRRLFPKLLQLAENNPDVLFVKVNGGDDSLSSYVESLGVNKLPYFHFYRAGRLTAHFAANLNKISLLRAELAAQKDCREPSCIL